MNKSEVAQMAQLKQKVTDLDDKIDIHITEQREDFNKVFEKLDALHGKFAGKWVEKFSVGVMISVAAGIIIFVITTL